MLLRALHGLWALLGLATCIVLAVSRGGHPPAIVLLPVALPVWAGGHLMLWGAARLHRRALAKRPRIGLGAPPWPILVSLVGSGLFTFVVFWWIAVSWALADGREDWLRSPFLWGALLLPWLLHAVCFLALLARHPLSGGLAAAIWAAWGAVLAWQVVRELSRYGPRAPGELALALALIATAAAMATLVWRARHSA